MSVPNVKEGTGASKPDSRPQGTTRVIRRWPVGAELLPDGVVHFRVWAPQSSTAHVELSANSRPFGKMMSAHRLEPEAGGYFSGAVAEAAAGMLYKIRLNSGSYPDPASRFQPEGPHGPSEIIDPGSFRWTDSAWEGPSGPYQVIYEIHVGTLTSEGTWTAAAERLGDLADLGVTVIEVMPVADFPGRFGWGYDGVSLYAPTRLYGRPDDLRGFVNRAHELGMAVILDVVYNHLGPDGNYLKLFSEDYFTDRYANEWGEAINFDGDQSGPVRELFVSNAGYWIDEFHLDGVRFDATQQVFDSSPEHVLAEITRQVRQAALGRRTYIVAENEPQETRLVRPVEQGGFGMDALWNDDFHHAAIVALTGRSEAYYTDYKGSPQEFISTFKWGYLYQGQRYKWQKKRRGSPTFGLEPGNFVNYIQNHDQIANSLRGARAHALTSPAKLRAMTALFLLGPGSPMLFQGQEFAASNPFLYFADHKPDLARLVAKGRREFLSQFPTLTCPTSALQLALPESEETFARCKLDFRERERNQDVYQLHKDLLRLRKEDPLLSQPRRGGMDGAVLGPEAFVLRFFGQDAGDRLLLVNFGLDVYLDPAPEPLLAPMVNSRWKTHWSSEEPCYGGCGMPPLDTEENWWIPGNAAAVLLPEMDQPKHATNHT
jgi:maltooligosyltrehalose trehalohydrolase